jgi:hypothetical protein
MDSMPLDTAVVVLLIIDELLPVSDCLLLVTFPFTLFAGVDLFFSRNPDSSSLDAVDPELVDFVLFFLVFLLAVTELPDGTLSSEEGPNRLLRNDSSFCLLVVLLLPLLLPDGVDVALFGPNNVFCTWVWLFGPRLLPVVLAAGSDLRLLNCPYMLDSPPDDAGPRLEPEFILFGPESLLLSNRLFADPVLPDRLSEEVLVNDRIPDLLVDLFVVVGVDMFLVCTVCSYLCLYLYNY